MLERLKALIAIVVLVILGVGGYYAYTKFKPAKPAPAPAPPPAAPVAKEAPAPAPAPAKPAERPSAVGKMPEKPDTRAIYLHPDSEAAVHKVAQSFMRDFMSNRRGAIGFAPKPISVGFDNLGKTFGVHSTLTQNRVVHDWEVAMVWNGKTWQLYTLSLDRNLQYSAADKMAKPVVPKPGVEPVLLTARERDQVVAGTAERKAKPAAGKKPPAETKPVMRTWTDATGKYKLEAEFHGLVDGKVKLRAADGSEKILALEKLSAADREWVRDPSKRKSAEPEPVSEEPQPAAQPVSESQPAAEPVSEPQPAASPANEPQPPVPSP